PARRVEPSQRAQPPRKQTNTVDSAHDDIVVMHIDRNNAHMPRPSHDRSQQIVHLGITLNDVTPEVSRIVAVPLGIHLDTLHLVLQAAMGWSNTHLWLIEAGGFTWGVTDPDLRDGSLPADRTTLIDMVADTGMKASTTFTTLVTSGSTPSQSSSQCPPPPGSLTLFSLTLSADARLRTAADRWAG